VQGGRERAREMIVVGFALLTAGAHAELLREARADEARPGPLRVRGDYAALAPAPAGDVELTLKSGFSAFLHRPQGFARTPEGVLRPRPQAGAVASVGLRVAKLRAAAAEIDATFVPIGPTVELSAGAGRADLTFVAEQFRVRRGQRLVLAVEQAGCASPALAECRRWRLAPARYDAGRCVARDIEPAGLRMQFGSLTRE
jgi:hypothetical protein